MIDNFTRAALAVIAVALATIAVQGMLPSPAGAQFEGCGSSSDPCYVYADSPIAVRVFP